MIGSRWVVGEPELEAVVVDFGFEAGGAVRGVAAMLGEGVALRGYLARNRLTILAEASFLGTQSPYIL